MGKKGTIHRKFSKEEKMKYAGHHPEVHIPVAQIEKDYGIGCCLANTREVKMRSSDC